jgi:hypothetical protein
MPWGSDPGECPICGAAHCSCDGGPIEIAQLPARDAAVARERVRPLLVAETVQATVPPNTFTSATYRRPKKP